MMDPQQRQLDNIRDEDILVIEDVGEDAEADLDNSQIQMDLNIEERFMTRILRPQKSSQLKKLLGYKIPYLPLP